MFGFGWVTQSKIKRKIVVNNILTRAIKDFLSKNGFEHFESEKNMGKNCYKREELYIAIYTRDNDANWAVYEYVYNLAKEGKKVILLLGILVGEPLEGRLYKVEKEDILNFFEDNEDKNPVRDKYVSISGKALREGEGEGYPFENKDDLCGYLKTMLEIK